MSDLTELTKEFNFQPLNNHEFLTKKLDEFIHKYTDLQNFYYDLYIETFSDKWLQSSSCKFIQLYNYFKEVCRIINKIKNLVNYHQYTVILSDNIQWLNNTFNCKTKEPFVMLGSNELKVISTFKDIHSFLDKNNLYKLIDSNFNE